MQIIHIDRIAGIGVFPVQMKPRIIASITLLIAGALFTSCETPPAQSTAPKRTHATFDGPKDKIWPMIVSEVGLEYPVRVIEKDSGLISTDWVSLPAGYGNMNAGRWVVPPGGFLTTWDGLRMNMKVMAVENEPGKTLVTVNCHFEAFEDNVQKAWIVAASNGAIEDAILSRMEEKLPAALALPDKAPSVAAPAVTKSPGDSLMELKKLLDAGAITQAEYDAKRKAVVDKL